MERPSRCAFQIFGFTDLPLGALFATILLSVFMLLAFPEIPHAWFWEILAAVGIVVWALGAGFLGTPDVEQAAGPQEVETSDAESHDKLSPEFVALIKAINEEGRANRDEERREDQHKRLVDITTIILLALTAFAVFRQVHEMVKVYDPIREASEGRC